jgi:UDP-N-acetylmuramoyl-L-alanyl-D-glutamate--2,6-diaminopimelate ligase
MARWFVDRLPQQVIPSVSLRRLLPEARFVGRMDWQVFGCSDDHRRLEPGQVFVAVRKARPGYDGHVFVREALERGAAGVVVDRPCPEAGRLQILVPDTMVAHARICQALAGDPSQQLVTLGVTGSFGKTITALMVHSILAAAGKRFGLVSSLGFCDGTTTRPLGAGFDVVSAGGGASASGPRSPFGGCDREAGEFAPGAAGLARLLAEMFEVGCDGSVLEVSSHALLRRSFEGVAFHAAVVTDIAAPDGLPPEVLLEKRRAKAKLFQQIVPGGLAVVNADDPNAEVLGGINLDARRVAFALDSTAARPLDVHVCGTIKQLDLAGTRMTLCGFDREAFVHLPLVGRRAATCAVAAAAVAWALEIDRAGVVAGLEAVRAVAGHLEAVCEGQDFDVRVDAAQTSGALGEALVALRATSAGRVHCVLSAEGAGDPLERRKLAQTAEAGADRVIATVSNPRTEDPNQIIDDLLAGFRRPGKVRVELDRRSAIEIALADARAGDVVLITGKGRQSYQILADRVLPFDDSAVAREWLRAHRSRPAYRSA